MVTNLLFCLIICALAVFFLVVVFYRKHLRNLRIWTFCAFSFLVGGLMFVKFLAEGEIRKDENEISSLVSLLHSEIDSISSISAINKKSEYLKQTDRVLKQIDSIALRIKKQEAYTDIDIDSRLNSIRNIINQSKTLVETLNDTISINNFMIEKSYRVTEEEMKIQVLPLSNERNLSFMLRIYDEGLRDKAKAIFIEDKANIGIAYQYKDKQNHFVLPLSSQYIENSYKIGILTYNESDKNYTYYYIQI